MLCSAAATEAASSRQAPEQTTQGLGQRPFVTTKSNNEARRCGGNSQPDAFRGLPRNHSCSAERQPHLVLRRVWATIAANEALNKTMGDSWFEGKKWRNTRLDRGDGAARKCDEGEDDRGDDGWLPRPGSQDDAARQGKTARCVCRQRRRATGGTTTSTLHSRAFGVRRWSQPESLGLLSSSVVSVEEFFLSGGASSSAAVRVVVVHDNKEVEGERQKEVQEDTGDEEMESEVDGEVGQSHATCA